MPDPIACIRSYKAADKRLVQFMIGKANFATLAVANNRGTTKNLPLLTIAAHLWKFPVYTHPVALAIWFALSSAFIQYMNWWPIPSLGWFGYLKPVPAFATMAVPLMFLVDW